MLVDAPQGPGRNPAALSACFHPAPAGPATFKPENRASLGFGFDDPFGLGAGPKRGVLLKQDRTAAGQHTPVHPGLLAARIANPAPVGCLRRHFHGQAGPDIFPGDRMAERGSGPAVHAFELERDKAGNGQSGMSVTALRHHRGKPDGETCQKENHTQKPHGIEYRATR